MPARFGLVARIAVCAAVLSVETLLASYLIQATPLDAVTGAAEVVRYLQHWFFRFVIAYAMSLAILMYLRKDAFTALLASADHAPVRARYGILHALLLVPFAYLSAILYASSSAAWFTLIALAWHACAAAAALALLAALAPFSIWTHAARQTASVALFAVVPAAAAVAAIRVSQMLWAPAAELTFRIVVILLRPLRPALVSDPATLTLGTGRFAVQIAEVCSGLEGVGLMLAFCAAWLWFFRREYYFPRALIVVPLGVLLVFLLNAARIAALVLIGDAGYERIATVGFHSQAGWIGFNLAAFGVAILAHTNPWVSRTARTRRSLREAASAASRPADAAVDPAVRPEAGGSAPGGDQLDRRLSHAVAGGARSRHDHARALGRFRVALPLRFAGALVALWIYRRAYAQLDLRFSWRGPAVGAGAFLLWAAWRRVHDKPCERARAAGVDAGSGTQPLDRLPRARRRVHGSDRRRTRLPRISVAATDRCELRNGVLLGRPLARARGERRRVRHHARRLMVARHRRGPRLWRARDTHRPARRMPSPHTPSPMRCSRPMYRFRSVATLVTASLGGRHSR